MHGSLDDRVWRLRIHYVKQNVDHFVASGAQDHGTQNLFGFRIYSDFDQTLCFPFFKGPAHTDHGIFGNQRGAPRLPYLGVGHAASA